MAERDAHRRDELVDRLVREVAVHETFFLRHPDELRRVDWSGLLTTARLAGRSALRVWSAGCSSGEEAYSLVLVAAEALGLEEPPVQVLGTDISPAVLERARHGVYGPRSVRLLTAGQRTRWFAPDGPGLAVGDGLRRRVSFAPHNLVHDAVPPDGAEPFDVVVCRNVLIYFDADVAGDVADRLRRALRPGGTLVLGTADRLGPARAGRVARAAGPARAARPLAAPTDAPRPPRPGVRGPLRPTPGAPPPAPGAPPPAPAGADPHANRALDDGVRALREGEPAAAIAALRRALYLDPSLVAAGLHLGRAYEAAGDVRGARRAYWGVLRQADGLAPDAAVAEAVAPADLVAACRARLNALPAR
nr:protein-glutamate O-methyltransferase CheR [Patulibacter sp. SYSU D01012]